MILPDDATRGNPPICPHARPPRIDYLRSPMRPDDPQMAGMSRCEIADHVASFAESGAECAVRHAETIIVYDEIGRMRLTIAKLELEVLRLRHRLADLAEGGR
ncbi:MAG TPA: hypothetical protein VGL71_03195 [Urbifossiella sp.]|jgi:hypothetical protein